MKKRIQQFHQDENGFWSIIVVIILVTLALMAMGSYVLIRSEGIIAAEKAQGMQAEYTATGAMYYALKRSIADPDSSYSVTIDGSNVDVNLSSISSADFNRDVQVQDSVTVGNMTYSVNVVLDVFDNQVGIWCAGLVNDINPRNSWGSYDEDRMVQLANSVVSLDVAGLLALPNSQDLAGGTYSGTQPPSATGFFQPSGDLWVTRYNGNLTLSSNATHYGVVIVTGDLTIGDDAQVEGVIYMPNPDSNIIMQSDSYVDGCVICGGESTGNRWEFWIFSGVDTDVLNNPTRIDAILPYVSNPTAYINTAYNIHTWNE